MVVRSVDAGRKHSAGMTKSQADKSESVRSTELKLETAQKTDLNEVRDLQVNEKCAEVAVIELSEPAWKRECGFEAAASSGFRLYPKSLSSISVRSKTRMRSFPHGRKQRGFWEIEFPRPLI